jgi:hypothetical protein
VIGHIFPVNHMRVNAECPCDNPERLGEAPQLISTQAEIAGCVGCRIGAETSWELASWIRRESAEALLRHVAVILKRGDPALELEQKPRP